MTAISIITRTAIAAIQRLLFFAADFSSEETGFGNVSAFFGSARGSCAVWLSSSPALSATLSLDVMLPPNTAPALLPPPMTDPPLLPGEPPLPGEAAGAADAGAASGSSQTVGVNGNALLPKDTLPVAWPSTVSTESRFTWRFLNIGSTKLPPTGT